MIIARLMGGLGNQMFQYAAARCLASRRQTTVGLDTSFLERDPAGAYTKRAFELGAFGLEHLVITPRQARRVERAGNPLRRRSLGRPRLTQVQERHHGFDPTVLEQPDGSVLVGYWQSERYFLEIADTIRAELRPADAPSPQDEAVLSLMRRTTSVSVHVRRGDYVSLAAASAHHGTMPTDYYRAALDHVTTRASGEVHAFVFSDDPDWCRANLDLGCPTLVVDHNRAATAAADLHLMSQCRHHVIANSSFSWWGAWLDGRPESIVCAPRRWLLDEATDTRDVIPDRWVRL